MTRLHALSITVFSLVACAGCLSTGNPASGSGNPGDRGGEENATASIDDRPAADDGPRLGATRTTQAMVTGGELSLLELRRMGREIFSTPFNVHDGLGDGPMNPDDPISPGGRPTLQDNGMFTRVNGMDSQACVECHSFLSTATVPPAFGIGGVGTAVNNAIAGPSVIDIDNEAGAGFVSFDGRFINPPFLFGSGGVELLAKEMTADLQALMQEAADNPGTAVALISKGVDFGFVQFEDGQIDASGVEGIDADLVVRPFGRKGEFATVRDFDVGAMQFHFGMQAVELVGENEDSDGDGVSNEIMVGELSVLHIFNTTLERPVEQIRSAAADRGAILFDELGCTGCHVPELVTASRDLPLTFPEVHNDPFSNIYIELDLTAEPTGFVIHEDGGVSVPLYSDLKRHDMGDDLAETTGGDLDRFFVTARLWGIADTAPYMHDGRATTLDTAIILHAGEAQDAADAYVDLSSTEQTEVIAFLNTLRTPASVGDDLDGSQ